jgi:hypothetical protein
VRARARARARVCGHKGEYVTGEWLKLYNAALWPVIRPPGYNADLLPTLMQRLRIHVALCLISYGDDLILTSTHVKYGYDFKRLVKLLSASLRCL